MPNVAHRAPAKADIEMRASPLYVIVCWGL